MIAQDEDDTAMIDLSIGFFCAVLAIFALIEFNSAVTPEPPVPLTTGQQVKTLAATPPGWSAVNQRKSFAVFSGDRLSILNMRKLADGVMDIFEAYSADDGYQMFAPLSDSAPNSFKLQISFSPHAPPEPWLRETVTLNAPADANPDASTTAQCPETARPLITVFIPHDAGDLTALLAMAEACGLTLRLKVLAEPSNIGLVQETIELHPAVYSAENIFR